MYLRSLSLRLATGAAKLPEDLRRRHGDYFRAAQREDGGFAGRQGPSDPYYTGFGLRGLALTGTLDEPAAAQAASFLAGALGRPLAVVDLMSLVYGAALLEALAGIDVFAQAGRDRAQTLLAAVTPLRRPDGGYAKSPKGAYSSTYHTFLAALAKELSGLEHEAPERSVEMVLARQRGDGGFVELAPLRQSGTNPTSAAVGLLKMLDALGEPVRGRAASFLTAMQTPEGGLRANTQIPVADLLSTFTGLVALADLGSLDSVDLAAARAYVQSLEVPQGGFRGAAWDTGADVEYTFYGLGTLALLQEARPT